MVFFVGGPQLGELEAGTVANWLGAPFSVDQRRRRVFDRDGLGRRDNGRRFWNYRKELIETLQPRAAPLGKVAHLRRV